MNNEVGPSKIVHNSILCKLGHRVGKAVTTEGTTVLGRSDPKRVKLTVVAVRERMNLVEFPTTGEISDLGEKAR